MNRLTQLILLVYFTEHNINVYSEKKLIFPKHKIILKYDPLGTIIIHYKNKKYDQLIDPTITLKTKH